MKRNQLVKEKRLLHCLYQSKRGWWSYFIWKKKRYKTKICLTLNELKKEKRKLIEFQTSVRFRKAYCG